MWLSQEATVNHPPANIILRMLINFVKKQSTGMTFFIAIHVSASVLFDLHLPFCCRYLLRPPSDSDVRLYVDNLIEAL